MAALARMIKATTAPADPADVEIPQLRDDPEFAAASDLLSDFSRHQERLERERYKWVLEQDLSNREPNPTSTNDAMLVSRLAELRAAPPLAPSALAAPSAPTPAIAIGLDLLRGAPAPTSPDFRERISETDRQLAAIKIAIREQTEIVDNIAGELTLKYAKQLQPAWNALQLEMYRAAQELARTTRRVQEMRAAITAAGIGSRSDVLAMPNVRAPLMLGDESIWDSEISGWRRILERMGILK